MVFVNQILGVILKETLILVQNYIQHYIEIGKIYALIFSRIWKNEFEVKILLKMANFLVFSNPSLPNPWIFAKGRDPKFL